MDAERVESILEAALLAAGRPLSLDVLCGLFEPQAETPTDDEQGYAADEGAAALQGVPGRGEVKAALEALAEGYAGRGIELREVASGYRIQIRQSYAEVLRPLWSERPSRYSRALLETLALIAYRQPITRGEIEDIRGVSVSSSIIKTLLERDWIRLVGHRDVPGKPAMYGTTRRFLDYFNLRSLADLPTLAEIHDIDAVAGDLFGDSEDRSPESDDSVAIADDQGAQAVVQPPAEPAPLALPESLRLAQE